MTIYLYNTTTDKRGINKNLTQAQEVQNVELKLPTDIERPTFILRKTSNLNINYCYVPEFNRYYFTSSPKLLKGGMMELSCEVDTLESFKEWFLERTCYIERCEKKFTEQNNAMKTFFDNQLPIRNDVIIEALPVGTVGNGVNYYLTCNGGVQ